MIITEGIVIKERSVGEQDKFIDILTKEYGVVEAAVKGARKINGKSGSSTQLFAYSRFCLQLRKERYYLNTLSWQGQILFCCLNLFSNHKLQKRA